MTLWVTGVLCCCTQQGNSFLLLTSFSPSSKNEKITKVSAITEKLGCPTKFLQVDIDAQKAQRKAGQQRGGYVDTASTATHYEKDLNDLQPSAVSNTTVRDSMEEPTTL